MNKKITGQIDQLEKDQTIILTRQSSFNEGDIQRVLDILTDSAIKNLKVRKRKLSGKIIGLISGDSNYKYSKVTGIGEVQGNMMILKVYIPMDSRYEQPDPTKFNQDWSNKVNSNLSVMSGGFIDKKFMTGA